MAQGSVPGTDASATFPSLIASMLKPRPIEMPLQVLVESCEPSDMMSEACRICWAMLSNVLLGGPAASGAATRWTPFGRPVLGAVGVAAYRGARGRTGSTSAARLGRCAGRGARTQFFGN